MPKFDAKYGDLTGWACFQIFCRFSSTRRSIPAVLQELRDGIERRLGSGPPFLPYQTTRR
jgi:hypothetical protein